MSSGESSGGTRSPAPPTVIVSDQLPSSREDEDAIDHDDRDHILCAEETPEMQEILDPFQFKPLPTLPISIIQIVSNVGMVVLVFLLPILCDGDDASDSPYCIDSPFSLLIYSHGFHWTIHLIADQYLKQQHKKSRISGYLEFYLQTKNIRRTPFYIISFGNAVLLITITILHDYCDAHGENCETKYTKVDYLRGLITLECLVVICLVFNYIINVREFHRKRHPPDVYREDIMYDVYNGPNPLDSLRIGRDPNLAKDEILEKQAEIIRYLQSHTDKLNQKILALTHQLSQRF